MTESGFPAWLAAQAAEREEQGLTRRLAEPAISDRGEPLLDLAGNDYLGLARDPRVVAGAVAAAQAYGAGACASRLVSGTLSIHTELEQAMAAFTGFPSALAFPRVTTPIFPSSRPWPTGTRSLSPTRTSTPR
jgi:8-amino-7-oxononanoate synthase